MRLFLEPGSLQLDFIEFLKIIKKQNFLLKIEIGMIGRIQKKNLMRRGSYTVDEFNLMIDKINGFEKLISEANRIEKETDSSGFFMDKLITIHHKLESLILE